jgi:hypothetical protein
VERLAIDQLLGSWACQCISGLDFVVGWCAACFLLFKIHFVLYFYVVCLLLESKRGNVQAGKSASEMRRVANKGDEERRGTKSREYKLPVAA